MNLQLIIYLYKKQMKNLLVMIIWLLILLCLIQEKLIKLDDVQDAHHIHFWSLDGERHVLTAHIVVARELTAEQRGRLKLNISDALQGFNLAHTTIELEYPDEPCRDH